MTYTEAKEVFEKSIKCQENCYFCNVACSKCEYDYNSDDFDVAKKLAIKALEKQIPKKPIYSHYEEDDDGENLIPTNAECPVCGYSFEFGYWNYEDNHHCVCGQAIDWK